MYTEQNLLEKLGNIIAQAETIGRKGGASGALFSSIVTARLQEAYHLLDTRFTTLDLPENVLPAPHENQLVTLSFEQLKSIYLEACKRGQKAAAVHLFDEGISVSAVLEISKERGETVYIGENTAANKF